MKTQITVRNLDPTTTQCLRDVARQRNLSLNKAAILLIRRGAGLKEPSDGPETVGASLDSFIGSWTAEQETALLNCIRSLEQLDQSLWR